MTVHQASLPVQAGTGLADLRLAVVSTSVPPSPSGQARVLGLLLAEGACPPPIWFTDSPAAIEPDEPRHGEIVALGPARFLLVSRLKAQRLHRANNWAGLAATVLRRSGEITARLRGRQVNLVIGCSGSPFDLPAAWLAARRLRLPFAAWLFDDPVMQWPETEIYRGFARFWERRWARAARAVIVPNEVMAAHFRAREGGVAPRLALVRNPAAEACFGAPPAAWPEESDPRPRVISYTGSVYSAQADAFRNLIAALDALGGRFVLHLRTAQPPEVLAALGIAGPHVVHHPATSHAEAIAAQRDAEVLFLPLAFDSPIGEVILSSAPGKTGEYLAAGRPVLAHVPRSSFVAEFFARTGAGLVVDTPEPARLVEALRRLDAEPALRARITAAAAAAAEEFRVGQARAALGRALAGHQ